MSALLATAFIFLLFGVLLVEVYLLWDMVLHQIMIGEKHDRILTAGLLLFISSIVIFFAAVLGATISFFWERL
jgi:TRAP-type mannitol/chloroaromatic compound transport system permease small subunit